MTAPASVPTVAADLELRVEPLGQGRIAPAITLRVYRGQSPTSIGVSIPVRHAQALAAAILGKAKDASDGEP